LLVQNFVSAQEEADLISFLYRDEESWHNLSRRRVRHFGYAFLYETRGVDPKSPIEGVPRSLYPIMNKLKGLCPALLRRGAAKVCGNCGACAPDQITVNEYPAGVGISPHCDTHSAFEDSIVSLSLRSTAVCQFRNPVNGEAISVFLPRRSLLLMTGEARYAWQHYIPHRKWDFVYESGSALPKRIDRGDYRLSLTFRKVRCARCECNGILCS